MRLERKQRIERQGTAQLAANVGSKSGKVVVEAMNVGFSFDEKPVVKNFSTTVLRGDKIGVVGPNGVGKSTLVRLLLGELEPNTGEVHLGTNLDIAYFDQLRSQLRDDMSAMDNVSGGQDMVEVNGTTKHIISYLQDFLFMPARADYPGTVLLISHDREFLDNTVTSTLVFGDAGKVYDYVGGYSDAMPQFAAQQARRSAAASDTKPATAVAKVNKATAKKAVKLSYKDQRELDALPLDIEAAEGKLEALQATMAAADFYTSGKDTSAVIEEAAVAEQELTRLFERWDELESRQRGSGA